MGFKSSDRRVLRRMDSDVTMRMVNRDKGFCGVCRVIVDRSWSGNLGPPKINKVGPTYQRMDKTNSRKQRRRMGSTSEINYEAAGIQPHLVRSGGLRRDWSFENLDRNDKEWKKKNQTR